MKPKPWKLYTVKIDPNNTENLRCCGKLIEDDSGNLYPFLDPIDDSSCPERYGVIYFTEEDILKEVKP